MKRYLSIIAFFSILIQGCSKEEKIGQFSVDGIAPGPVTAAVVENVAGGAIITYSIPNDIDLLYVKASYMRNGKLIEQKASVYDSKLIIEGLGKSREQNVTLVAYDRSENSSTPVAVTIHPLDAPIFAILQSIKGQNDFGGIRLDWNNPLTSNVIVSVITKTNKFGIEEYAEAENFYTSTAVGKGNVRGFSDDEREFGVFVRDRWGNVTDTIFKKYKPFYEVALDKSLFRRWNPPGIPYSAYTTSNWYIENLWDGRVDLPTSGGTGFANFGLEFTFDMGKLAKISRFKINQRPETQLIYNYGHPKKFQIWGSSSPNVNADFSGWTLLGEFESIKPSNLPLGQVTDEDIAYAHTKGEEWDVPLTAPPVRYIRFVCLETWAQANDVQVMELSVWGDTKF